MHNDADKVQFVDYNIVLGSYGCFFYVTKWNDNTGLQPNNCTGFFDCFRFLLTETRKYFLNSIFPGFLAKLIFLV